VFPAREALSPASKLGAKVTRNHNQSGGRIYQKSALSGASKPNFEAKLADW
jgi:hypothetical protein